MVSRPAAPYQLGILFSRSTCNHALSDEVLINKISKDTKETGEASL